MAKSLSVRKYGRVAFLVLREDERFCSPDCLWQRVDSEEPEYCRLFMEDRTYNEKEKPGSWWRCRRCRAQK